MDKEQVVYVQRHTRDEALPFVTIVDDELMQHDLLYMRQGGITTAEFRRRSNRIAAALVRASSLRLPTRLMSVMTAMNRTAEGRVIDDVSIVLIPILRAGVAFLAPAMERFPWARVGYVGQQRNETDAVAANDYDKVPKIGPRDVVIPLDPMLATGGSGEGTICNLIENKGARRIILVTVVSAPDGVIRIHRLNERYQALGVRIEILTAALDPLLDNRAFILPGLGDYGDRWHGTNDPQPIDREALA